MTKKISQWQRMALLAASISTSMGSAAWAGNTALYQFHSDGTVWAYTGVPCNGNVCNGWRQIGNNDEGRPGSLVAAGAEGADQLFSFESGTPNMYDDGPPNKFTGQPCISFTDCPGWQAIGWNQNSTFYDAFAAGGGQLVALSAIQYDYNSEQPIITQYSTQPQACGNTCPWIIIDVNSDDSQVYAGYTGIFLQHYSDSSIWKYTGVPCSDVNIYILDTANCPGWVQIDSNPYTVSVAPGVGNTYQMWQNGAVWQYTGIPCSPNACTGWMPIGDNPNTTQIVAGSNLYSTLNDGSIWQYSGTPCNGSNCSGWYEIDNNPDMAYIVAGYSTVYEVHKSGSIWQYTGTPCNTTTHVCSGWEMLDDNPLNVDVVAGY
jgi:hypothetical protein